MARATSSSERTIPHLRDIFGGGGTRYAPTPQTQISRDLNEINYKFQNEMRVSSKSKGKYARKHKKEKKMEFESEIIFFSRCKFWKNHFRST